MQPGARTEGIVRLIDNLKADIIALQEVEEPLVTALDMTNRWQTFYSQKRRGKPDGCLTLVRPDITVASSDTLLYSDDSGHIAQILHIGQVAFANTHIKWAPADDPHHIGAAEAAELIEHLADSPQAVVLADANDEPGGPVCSQSTAAGFTDIFDRGPTALVDQEPINIDLIAVRGTAASRMHREYSIENIPSVGCPSNHIPLVADL